MIPAWLNSLSIILLILGIMAGVCFILWRPTPPAGAIALRAQRPGMPLMWNAVLFASMAIGLVIGAVLINVLVAELSQIAWGAVTGILAMLTMAFGKVVDTNIYLIKQQAQMDAEEPVRIGGDPEDPDSEIPL